MMADVELKNFGRRMLWLSSTGLGKQTTSQCSLARANTTYYNLFREHRQYA